MTPSLIHFDHQFLSDIGFMLTVLIVITSFLVLDHALLSHLGLFKLHQGILLKYTNELQSKYSVQLKGTPFCDAPHSNQLTAMNLNSPMSWGKKEDMGN